MTKQVQAGPSITTQGFKKKLQRSIRCFLWLHRNSNHSQSSIHLKRQVKKITENSTREIESCYYTNYAKRIPRLHQNIHKKYYLKSTTTSSVNKSRWAMYWLALTRLATFLASSKSNFTEADFSIGTWLRLYMQQVWAWLANSNFACLLSLRSSSSSSSVL